MYLKEPVVVTDILEDPLWSDYRDLANGCGLRACWSTPIQSYEGKVLGSFAMYYREPREPNQKERALTAVATHLARIAIEREQGEEALKRSEEKNLATLRAIPDLMFLLSADGVYLDCHAKSPEELLLPPEQLLGKNMRDVLPLELAEKFASCIRWASETDEPQVLEYDLAIREHVRPSEARVVRAGGGRFLVVVRDVTERRRAEDELRRRSEQVRELAGRLLAAQEDERRRVARELHDDLSQKVAALALNISRMKRRLPEEVDFVLGELGNLQRQINELAGDIRQLSHRLHPAVLEHAGLAAALKSFTSEFSRNEGIEIKLIASPDSESIPRETGICMYRVVQEALRNVAKHSGARRAAVILSVNDGEAQLVIKDEGRGFDLNQARGDGLGMASIEERVRLCQGIIQITSQLNRGTTVNAKFPLPDKSAGCAKSAAQATATGATAR